MTELWALPLTGVCLGLIMWHDVARFEILFELLFPTAALVLLCRGDGALDDAAIGAAIWGSLSGLMYFLGSRRLGRGDIGLFLFAGFCFGLGHTVAGGVVFALASAVTAYAYSRARGKRAFASSYPAALPMVVSILVVMEIRIIGSAVESDMRGVDTAIQMLLPVMGVILGALAHPLVAALLRNRSHD